MLLLIVIQVSPVKIPSTVTSIGAKAFLNCYSLVEVFNLSSVTITKGESSNSSTRAGQYALSVHTTDEPSDLVAENGVMY